MMNCVMIFVVFVGLLSTTFVASAKHKPKPIFTEQLPGLEVESTFKMFSGYLHAGTHTKKLFYWLNEAQDVESNILVVWFQGGPGCSSLRSLFKENGPYTFNDESGTLEPNEFSWNRKWHTLYIEAPLDTGFSFSKTERNGPSDDINAVEDMRSALEYFLHDLHRKYQDFDIYFGGVSYAGIYLPTLASLLMKENETSLLRQRFKGLILGNPRLNTEMKERAVSTYAYRQGLITNETYAVFEQLDCFSSENRQACAPSRRIIGTTLFSGKIDPRNYAKPCFRRATNQTINIPRSADPRELSLEQRQQLMDQENGCMHPQPLRDYLNQRAVKIAIHARKSIKWSECSPKVVFHHQKILDDMTENIKNITQGWGKKVLLYYGDRDITVNFVSGKTFINQLGMTKLGPRSLFMVKYDENQQGAGGMIEKYQHLQFATIFNAGHNAVEDKPREVLQLVENFINSSAN